MPQTQTIIGQANPLAIMFFVAFVISTLLITWWAAKRTRTTKDFYAAGRSITGFQNGLALAGDYMSAASFLGIAGLVSTKGYDGLIYSVGWLVGWPIIMFLISEPLRNLGKYTFADVVAFRLRQRPIDLDHRAGQQVEFRHVGLVEGLGLRDTIRFQAHRLTAGLQGFAGAVGPDGLGEALAAGQFQHACCCASTSSRPQAVVCDL